MSERKLTWRDGVKAALDPTGTILEVRTRERDEARDQLTGVTNLYNGLLKQWEELAGRAERAEARVLTAEELSMVARAIDRVLADENLSQTWIDSLLPIRSKLASLSPTGGEPDAAS